MCIRYCPFRRCGGRDENPVARAQLVSTGKAAWYPDTGNTGAAGGTRHRLTVGAVAVAYTLPVQLYAYTPPVHVYYSCSILISSYSRSRIPTCTLTGSSPYDLRPKVAIKGRARSAMMAYLGDTTTAHNAAPPPRSTTTTPARVTYPCSHRQCQLGVQGVGAEQRNPLTLPSYHRLAWMLSLSLFQTLTVNDTRTSWAQLTTPTWRKCVWNSRATYHDS